MRDNWICHPADRFNVARGLLAPVVLFTPLGFGFPDHYTTLAVVLIFGLIGNTNYLLHLHIHRPFTRKKWLNLVLDLHMGFATGMTASNWRI